MAKIADLTLKGCSGKEYAFGVYPPEPCNEIMNLNGNTERIYYKKIAIYNLVGQKILEKINAQNLDISNLSSGVYIIKGLLSDNEIMTKKIYKNK